MGATGTRYHLARSTSSGLQAVPVDLPAGRPPATPGTAGPPRVRDVRPPRGTRATCMRPSGWQVPQVFQSVTIPRHGSPTDPTPSPPDSSNGYRSAGLIHTEIIMTDRGLFLAWIVFIIGSSWSPLGVTKRGSLFYKTCISPNFETLPLHFIPWHPSPTHHSPR